MSGKIAVLVEFQIPEGKREEMEKVCQRAVEIARTKDRGTLSFNQYVNADDSVMISLETYRDSRALLKHLAAAAENIGRVSELATVIQVKIFGDASDEVKGIFKDLNPTYYRHHSGL